MRRRDLVRAALIATVSGRLASAVQLTSATPVAGQNLGGNGTAPASAAAAATEFRRVRPSDPEWPGAASWEQLNRDVRGHLIRVEPLLGPCADAPESAACTALTENLRNPFYIGVQPAGTQTSGWLDAWMPAPSAYAVAATTPQDVVAAVNF